MRKFLYLLFFSLCILGGGCSNMESEDLSNEQVVKSGDTVGTVGMNVSGGISSSAAWEQLVYNAACSGRGWWHRNTKWPQNDKVYAWCKEGVLNKVKIQGINAIYDCVGFSWHNRSNSDYSGHSCDLVLYDGGQPVFYLSFTKKDTFCVNRIISWGNVPQPDSNHINSYESFPVPVGSCLVMPTSGTPYYRYNQQYYGIEGGVFVDKVFVVNSYDVVPYDLFYPCGLISFVGVGGDPDY